MATWRCPNCRTAQADSTRCFLCGRSATSCGTCAQFRSSVVGGVGYCGLDRRREPLSGAEQRDCWSDAQVSAAEGLFDGPPLPVIESGLGELSAAPAVAARAVSGG